MIVGCEQDGINTCNHDVVLGEHDVQHNHDDNSGEHHPGDWQSGLLYKRGDTSIQEKGW